jgi:hypothetical protein
MLVPLPRAPKPFIANSPAGSLKSVLLCSAQSVSPSVWTLIQDRCIQVHEWRDVSAILGAATHAAKACHAVLCVCYSLQPVTACVLGKLRLLLGDVAAGRQATKSSVSTYAPAPQVQVHLQQGRTVCTASTKALHTLCSTQLSFTPTLHSIHSSLKSENSVHLLHPTHQLKLADALAVQWVLSA